MKYGRVAHAAEEDFLREPQPEPLIWESHPQSWDVNPPWYVWEAAQISMYILLEPWLLCATTDAAWDSLFNSLKVMNINC